jgi:hypothetical protein
MNVIPDAADWGGAAAWAYLPGQTSAFRSSYSYRMGVQLHEVSHNIGLHHSGYGTESYADHSCLMGKIDTSDQCIHNLQSLFEGKTLLSADLCFLPSFFYIAGNPSYGDDGPKICWNGAKSWETRWYAADSVDVVPSFTAPFTADLIGAADWSEGTFTPGNHKIVLRITDSSVT